MSDLNTLIKNLKGAFVRPEESRPTSLGDAENIPLDDTTGWSQLESALGQTHSYIIARNLEQFEGILTNDVIQVCIRDPSVHMSRHVRQSTLEFVKSLLDKYFKPVINMYKVHLQLEKESSADASSTTSILIYRQLFDAIYDAVSDGLHDNWSEIRLAACHAARPFLQSLSEVDQTLYWPKLLPRLCMSRFYAAEGVKVYSMDTWKSVIKTRGKQLIVQYIEHIVSHYVDMSRAKNHMVSEAACLAISEIIGKIESSVVRPYLYNLLEGIKGCLLETSWPVRDAACSGTGLFVKNYPLEATPYIELFLSTWSRQLCDSIWSVRENAAFAIGDALTTSDPTLRKSVFEFTSQFLLNHIHKAKEEISIEDSKKPKISNFLPTEMLVAAADKQAASSRSPPQHQQLSTLPAQPGIGQSKKVWRTGGGWGCCLDCVVERKQSPWEASAGCVVLLRELLRAAGDLAADPFAVEKFPRSAGSTATATTTASSSIAFVDSDTLVGLAERFIDPLWALLTVAHFPDAFKLHLLVLQQLPEVYRCWSGALGRVAPGISQSITSERLAIVSKLPSQVSGVGKFAINSAVEDFMLKMNVYASKPTPIKTI